MKMYIELWKATPAWIELSKEDRGNYMGQLGPAIGQLVEQGAEILNWGVCDPDTYKKADYDFFAVWRFPSADVAKSFEKMVAEAGWYLYFEQVNMMGDATTPEEVIGKMINL